ncbi:hypothetical protein C8Q76DRAFT_571479, partial [Earliella scabrosa]
MNPRVKKSYFRKELWPQEWIDTAMDLLRTEWERYKPASSVQPELSESQGTFFSSMDGSADDSEIDALEEYFLSPPIPRVTDPIKYWHALDDGKNPLARMALDILSCPG